MIGYRAIYVGSMVALALSGIAKTLSFLLLATFVDEALLTEDVVRAVALIALSFIGLALVEGAFSFLSGRLAAQTAEGVTQRLRNFMFDHLQRLSFPYHDKAQTGDLIQRVTSDISAIQRFYSEQVVQLGRVLLLFVINFVALLSLNTTLALSSTIIVPFIAIVSLFFFRRIEKAYDDYQAADAKLSTVLQENLSGVRVVKAFARQPYEEKKFDHENSSRFAKGRRLLSLHSLYWPVSDILASGQMLAGLMLGATMVMRGDITLGTFLAYAGMIIWIVQPMRGLGRLIVQASTGLVSFDRIAGVVREEQEPLKEGTQRPQTVQGDLVFENVSFEYETDVPVLHDISFSVKPGEIVALLGSTGSGKTTLVSLLPRFYEYTSGRILLDGVPLTDYPKEVLRDFIGIVEQEPFLFSRTIRDNIAYGVDRQVTDEEVIAAAQAAAIHERILQFPQGYDTIVGEKGVTLSGGQKQRVAIARTILKNPRILLLDDATSSVDTETEAEIRGALENLMSARTTFVIAHRIQSVMIADQILVMDKGRIVQRGSHDELVNQPGTYRQIYDLQARIESELEKEIASV
ncbi:MAG: ABC transporter ATP-binding protein/permease [Pleurocapsa minor GSE-CHR-MK-17-07R]|nr:ABC transporter ATP-binding protein/permease [Pleurocapsa minor GSE-CHR-MK 17-07R]